MGLFSLALTVVGIVGMILHWAFSNMTAVVQLIVKGISEKHNKKYQIT